MPVYEFLFVVAHMAKIRIEADDAGDAYVIADRINGETAAKYFTNGEYWVDDFDWNADVAGVAADIDEQSMPKLYKNLEE